MKNGAYDYVINVQHGRTAAAVGTRYGTFEIETENRILREKVKSKQGFGGIVVVHLRWRSCIGYCQSGHSTHPY